MERKRRSQWTWRCNHSTVPTTTVHGFIIILHTVDAFYHSICTGCGTEEGRRDFLGGFGSLNGLPGWDRAACYEEEGESVSLLEFFPLGSPRVRWSRILFRTTPLLTVYTWAVCTQCTLYCVHLYASVST
jgi:hypothetical protein